MGAGGISSSPSSLLWAADIFCSQIFFFPLETKLHVPNASLVPIPTCVYKSLSSPLFSALSGLFYETEAQILNVYGPLLNKILFTLFLNGYFVLLLLRETVSNNIK